MRASPLQLINAAAVLGAAMPMKPTFRGYNPDTYDEGPWPYRHYYVQPKAKRTNLKRAKQAAAKRARKITRSR